ncbi:hypothetical protein HanRHA438_Chr03g0138811 [Helianthus annuus]|nr:hypothetical protein HanRHA438_Chr03g0138811 [Helianthus annuus]
MLASSSYEAHVVIFGKRMAAALNHPQLHAHAACSVVIFGKCQAAVCLLLQAVTAARLQALNPHLDAHALTSWT